MMKQPALSMAAVLVPPPLSSCSEPQPATAAPQQEQPAASAELSQHCRYLIYAGPRH